MNGADSPAALPEGADLAGLFDDARDVVRDKLAKFFSLCGGPVTFDDLIDRVVGEMKLTDQVGMAEIDLESTDLADMLVDPLPGADKIIESVEGVRLLWDGVLELPTRHRKALLLNLRDHCGDNALITLTLTGVAGLRDIASALEIPVAELVEIWNSLPWDDRRIGEHMGLERQQVINLRQTARARLARWRDTTGNK
jgi:hypothetical protein